MRKNLLSTIAVCTIFNTFQVYTVQSQTTQPTQPTQPTQATQPARPVPVATLTGAASQDPKALSIGTIDWSKTAQEIDGFGASAAFHMSGNLMNFSEPQRSEILDLLFSPTKGAGLSIERNYVGDGGSWGSKTNGPAPSIEPQEGVWNWTGDEDEIWIMQEAGKRGATRFMSTVWSPPAWMKTNNNVIGGHLRPDKYLAFAEYLSMYVRGYKEHHNIDIYAISLANEPDVTVKYSSCYWTGKEFHDFLKFLIPVFERDKITAKVIVGEHSGWTENPVLVSLEDSVTSARIDIVGVHAYHAADRDPFPPISQRVGPLVETLKQKKKIWQTEAANLGRNFSDIRDGIYWAKVLHTHVAENSANAWLYWWLLAPGNNGGSFVHIDMNKKTYTVDKRLFTIGNYSRFVRPGYFRIRTNSELMAGVLVSAYKSEPEKKMVVVVINENVIPRKMELDLVGVNATSAVPCRTSATEDLATLPELKITDNKLRATLAPGSVTTFVVPVRLP
jgi:glucuronoarabinoxylan endo-1,4-beta-xylanase